MTQTFSPELESYSLSEWKKGYDSQPHEDDYEITEIEGQIPAELSGTLFRKWPWSIRHRWNTNSSPL